MLRANLKWSNQKGQLFTRYCSSIGKPKPHLRIITIESHDNYILRNKAQLIQLPLSEADINFSILLKNEMLKIEESLGIAANQIGDNRAIICLHIPESILIEREDAQTVFPPTVLINPKYFPIEEDGKYIAWEGCLSIPGYVAQVPRFKSIYYEGITLEGKFVRNVATGFLARLIQHEIGHLKGELYTDLMTSECKCKPYENTKNINANIEQNNSLIIKPK